MPITDQWWSWSRRWVWLAAAGVLIGACATQDPSAPTNPASETTTTSVAITAATTTGAPGTTAPVAMTGRPQTTATLPPPTTTIPPKGWLVIHGVGDTNLDRSYIPNLAHHGYGFAFERLDGLFIEDDLTVVNLECSPSLLGAPLDKAFTFRCDPDSLPVAATSGIDVANLANNHSRDFGPEAMLDGRANVAAAGIAPVGVGADVTEATSPAVLERDGWTIAVVGMGGVVPGSAWLADHDAPGMASGDDIAQMTAAVQAAAQVADLVVVTIHWGWELETAPRADDRARAEAMIAAGADVIFGHHPHRLGELEYIDGRPVFWTLGNFVWPHLSRPSATTAVARVLIGPTGEIDACLIPAFIATSGRPELTGPPPCGPDHPTPRTFW